MPCSRSRSIRTLRPRFAELHRWKKKRRDGDPGLLGFAKATHAKSHRLHTSPEKKKSEKGRALRRHSTRTPRHAATSRRGRRSNLPVSPALAYRRVRSAHSPSIPRSTRVSRHREGWRLSLLSNLPPACVRRSSARRASRRPLLPPASWALPSRRLRAPLRPRRSAASRWRPSTTRVWGFSGTRPA